MTEGYQASVVIVTHNDPRAVRAIASILRETPTAICYEVILVENGSELLREACAKLGARVRYIHTQVANMAAARNAGLAAARGAFILSTDADCIPTRNWLSAMILALISRLDVVGGPIRKLSPSSPTQRFGITVVDGQSTLNYLPALRLPYVAGANAGYRADALRDIGGFDETLPSGNDVDVCYRLGLAGYRIGLSEAAVVYHEDRASVRSHFQRFRKYSVYQVRLFAKYRHLSGRRYVVNRYPWRRARSALRTIPSACRHLACGDSGPAWTVAVTLAEAAGVLCGNIEGAVRFRQLYI